MQNSEAVGNIVALIMDMSDDRELVLLLAHYNYEYKLLQCSACLGSPGQMGKKHYRIISSENKT